MKKLESILLLAALAAIALASAACSKTATNTNNTNTSTNTATVKTTNTNTATTPPTQASGSPTAVITAAFDASKKKDVAGFKKYLSSADLKELDEMTKRSGGSADEFLKEMMADPEATMPASLETRNEKIDGEKASVEFKGKDGEWKTSYFVKEGGEWKMKLGNPSAEQPAANKNSGADDEHGGSEH